MTRAMIRATTKARAKVVDAALHVVAASAMAFALAGCASVNQAEAKPATPEQLKAICIAKGYPVGSPPFERCMITEREVQANAKEIAADKREAIRKENLCLTTDDNAPGCDRGWSTR